MAGQKKTGDQVTDSFQRALQDCVLFLTPSPCARGQNRLPMWGLCVGHMCAVKTAYQCGPCV